MYRNKNFKISESEKINIINTCVTTYSTNIKYMLIQSMTQLLRISSKRHLVEVILLHLLNETLPNQLLDISILRISQERTMMDENKK